MPPNCHMSVIKIKGLINKNNCTCNNGVRMYVCIYIRDENIDTLQYTYGTAQRQLDACGPTDLCMPSKSQVFFMQVI